MPRGEVGEPGDFRLLQKDAPRRALQVGRQRPSRQVQMDSGRQGVAMGVGWPQSCGEAQDSGNTAVPSNKAKTRAHWARLWMACLGPGRSQLAADLSGSVTIPHVTAVNSGERRTGGERRKVWESGSRAAAGTSLALSNLPTPAHIQQKFDEA